MMDKSEITMIVVVLTIMAVVFVVILYSGDEKIDKQIRDDVHTDYVITQTSIIGFATEFMGRKQQVKYEAYNLSETEFLECIDSDVSENEYLTYAGITLKLNENGTNIKFSLNDHCIGNDILIERSCNGSLPSFTKVRCPSQCNDGRCLEIKYIECEDFEGNDDPLVSGNITYRYSFDDIVVGPAAYRNTLEDECIDDMTLLERSCKKNMPIANRVTCNIGCHEDRCLS